MTKQTVWKYELEESGVLALPAGAKVLCVQNQRERPCLWVLLNPENPKETRRFSIYGTGHPMPAQLGAYVGTFQLSSGVLVFHVFEDL